MTSLHFEDNWSLSSGGPVDLQDYQRFRGYTNQHKGRDGGVCFKIKNKWLSVAPGESQLVSDAGNAAFLCKLFCSFWGFCFNHLCCCVHQPQAEPNDRPGLQSGQTIKPKDPNTSGLIQDAGGMNSPPNT